MMTDNEIVADLLAKIKSDPTAVKSWMDIGRKDVISGHHTTGRSIRNDYKLWDKDNPHVVHDDGDHPRFPDQVSHQIMLRIWDELHEGDIK